MVGYKKRNYRKKVMPSKKRVIRKALAKHSEKKISKVVSKVLAKRVEVKNIQASATYYPRTLQSVATSILDNNVCLTPVSPFFSATSGNIIAEGTGQDERIGNEINIKAMYLNYSLTPMPYNATTNSTPKPMVVTIYVIRPKVGQQQGPDLGLYLSGNTNSNWFENQFNLDSGFAGNLSDLTRKIDVENYDILAVRRHKLGYAATSGTGSDTTRYGFANNDFKFMHQGRIKITSPKRISYDRQGYPKVQPIYALLQCVSADNQINPFPTTAVQWQWNTSIYYTDM